MAFSVAIFAVYSVSNISVTGAILCRRSSYIFFILSNKKVQHLAIFDEKALLYQMNALKRFDKSPNESSEPQIWQRAT